MAQGCRHRPMCPVSTPRWHCGKRTAIEQAVKAGIVSQKDAIHLLQLYGLPCSPESKVYTGAAPKKAADKLW